MNGKQMGMARQLTLEPNSPEIISDQKRILAILAELLAEIVLEIHQGEEAGDGRT